MGKGILGNAVGSSSGSTARHTPAPTPTSPASPRAQAAAPLPQRDSLVAALAARTSVPAQERTQLHWRPTLSARRTGRDSSRCDQHSLHNAIETLIRDLDQNTDARAEYLKAGFGLEHNGNLVSTNFSILAHELSRSQRAIFAPSTTGDSALLAAAVYIHRSRDDAFAGKRLNIDACMAFIGECLGLTPGELNRHVNTRSFKDIERISKKGEPLEVAFQGKVRTFAAEAPGKRDKGKERVDSPLAERLRRRHEPSRRPEDYPTIARYFRDLSQNGANVARIARANPAILKQQDENGDTLAHHLASCGEGKSSARADKCVWPLFSIPGVDLSLCNNEGDTAVHTAARSAANDVNRAVVLPMFLRAARRADFDFFAKGKDGLTVLQILAKTTSQGATKSGVEIFLERIGPATIDALSDEGGTAFCYAIRSRQPSAVVQALVKAGADLTLRGSPDMRPLPDLVD